MNVTRFDHVSVNANGASLDEMTGLHRDALARAVQGEHTVPIWIAAGNTIELQRETRTA